MELLREEAKALGLTLSQEHLERFDLYYRELTAWNERFNLTAITGYEAVQRRHFVDSLSCLVAFPGFVRDGSIPNTVPLQVDLRAPNVIDVGTGAGFPGLPIKIMLPEAHLTLIESTGKKTTFLQHMVRLLDLEDVQIINERAETVGHWDDHRECYDVVLARAVARLNVLAEYCLPFCRLGGRVIAPKGEDAEVEAQEAQGALETLGGTVRSVKPVHISGLESEHYLIVIDKVAHTPESYPRRPGMPSKRPLE
jgi:16S rRNA (guanine527-N7)-methyltransferase